LYEIRSAILSLSSAGVAEVGLVAAVERLVGDFEKIARITTSFATQGQICRLDPDIEDALYHVCQEALHNIFKHAQASQVMVKLDFTLDELTLNITDDGLGIDSGVVKQIEQRGVTFGLNNMFKRMAELGGMLWVSRLNGKGTKLTARISLKKKEERDGQNSYLDGG
jgi:two-component system sensor histidine kinase NreB